MGLAQVIYPPPDKNGLQTWLFDHWQHHLAIVQKANLLGFQLNQYNIWPVGEHNFQDFLLNHQNYHTEMNSIANVAGNDLQDLDLTNKKKADAWFYSNYVEHASVAQFLGGGI
jgi:hypothetical protein